MSKNIRRSLLLLSVGSIRRKLLKTTHAEALTAPIQFRKLQHLNWIVKNIFNSKQSIQILQTIIIDFF